MTDHTILTDAEIEGRKSAVMADRFRGRLSVLGQDYLCVILNLQVARKRIAELVADRERRWVALTATSPSGKALFVCKCCGRVSQAPDKGCHTYADPDEKWKCSTWKAPGLKGDIDD